MHSTIDPETRAITLTITWEEWCHLPTPQDMELSNLPLHWAAPLLCLLQAANYPDGLRAVLGEEEVRP